MLLLGGGGLDSGIGALNSGQRWHLKVSALGRVGSKDLGLPGETTLFQTLHKIKNASYFLSCSDSHDGSACQSFGERFALLIQVLPVQPPASATR